LNTFGFGDDHDSDCMIDIANIKDGNYYYISEVEDMCLCFVDSLGKLCSLLANQALITIKATPSYIPVKIKEEFMCESIWKY